VLSDITLVIEPGMRLGIRGSSGAGKSTLLELLLGLREPTTGTITADGLPLTDDVARHQRGIGYVPQTVPLLDDTVAANIAPGWSADEVDHDHVRAVLARVGLGAWLDALPGGTETVLGPGGPRMSGGQQLRLGLARALYANPVILVMDEVTAHLDPAATDEMVAVLAGLDGSITQVAVAHDPAAVAYCDVIIDLTGGRVSGTWSRSTDGAVA
jgi:ABC-type bacteriocin/lantibiotic exporter with double-glycine peptidase domain